MITNAAIVILSMKQVSLTKGEIEIETQTHKFTRLVLDRGGSKLKWKDSIGKFILEIQETKIRKKARKNNHYTRPVWLEYLVLAHNVHELKLRI